MLSGKVQNPVLGYIYKGGNVIETDISTSSGIEYKEREGYVYCIFNESGTYAESFVKMENSYPYFTTLFSDAGEYITGVEDCPAKGAEQIEKDLGINQGIWNEIDYCGTIDEAYTQMLSRNRNNSKIR